MWQECPGLKASLQDKDFHTWHVSKLAEHLLLLCAYIEISVLSESIELKVTEDELEL